MVIQSAPEMLTAAGQISFLLKLKASNARCMEVHYSQCKSSVMQSTRQLWCLNATVLQMSIYIETLPPSYPHYA